MQMTPQEREEQKRYIYGKMSPRRRKFVDKIGYDAWDPFAEPNHPIDIRTDTLELNAHDLTKAFMRAMRHKSGNEAYSQGAFDMANGIINGIDRYQGMLDFAHFYLELLREQGKLSDDPLDESRKQG